MRILFVVISFMFIASCAFNTDPEVRSYIHQQKAYKEIKYNRFSLALIELKKALADDPNNPIILNNMAYLFFKENKLDAAIGYLEQARAVRNKDDDDPYIMNEARIYIIKKDFKKAKQLLDLVKKRKNWPKGYKSLYAKLLWKEGKLKEALTLLLKNKNKWQ